jgi:hypothetical protein
LPANISTHTESTEVILRTLKKTSFETFPLTRPPVHQLGGVAQIFNIFSTVFLNLMLRNNFEPYHIFTILMIIMTWYIYLLECSHSALIHSQ